LAYAVKFDGHNSDKFNILFTKIVKFKDKFDAATFLIIRRQILLSSRLSARHGLRKFIAGRRLRLRFCRQTAPHLTPHLR